MSEEAEARPDRDSSGAGRVNEARLEELLAQKRPPSGFLPELRRIPFEDLLAAARGAGQADVARALLADPPDLEQAAVLLAAGDSAPIPDLLARSRAVTDRRFGRSVLLYAPCYLSSYCVNHCVYCGFSFGLDVSREFLPPAEVKRETDLLRDRGMRRILLVAGEYPARVSPGYLEGIIRQTREGAPEVDLEVAPARAEEYRRWSGSGARGVTCYQETYDEGRYPALHPRGPKTFFDYRLGTLERAGEGGMARLGAGILLGLGEPMRDLLALIAHVRFLARKFPDARLTASLPRLRPAVASFRAEFTLDDETFLRCFAVLRLALPEAGLVVSTRESAPLRRRLLEAGVTQMSAGSVTVPGGYSSPASGCEAGQFPPADSRSVPEVAADLERLGYSVRWTAGEAPDPRPVA